jgi:phage shock protein C
MKKLYRSRSDRIFAGICGGLSQYWEIDPTFVRLLTVLIWIFTGLLPLFTVYLIAWMIIPLEPSHAPHVHYKRLYRSKSDRMLAGICGGLAHLLHVDPSILRLVTVFLCFLTGIAPLLIAYLAGWIVIPEKK